MAVKSNRSERLLSLRGNVWWYRQGIPQAVHKVTGGPKFILINLRTSDIAEAKRRRDEIERATSAQFDEIKTGRRLSLALDGWGDSSGVRSAALPPADRGTVTRAALDASEDADERHLIITAAEAEAEAMQPAQRKAFEDAMAGKVEIEHHLETYLTLAELAPKTTNERRGIIMMFARWCREKGKTLDRVDRRLAGQYASEFLDGKHHVTQGKHLSALRQYWIYLARRGHVTPPAGEAVNSGWPWNDQAIEKKGKRVERGAQSAEERPFTDDEVKTLITAEYPFKAADAQVMKDVLLASLLSGMRQAEIVTLWVQEVVEEGGELFFDIQHGKTAAAARKVPVHSALAAMVRKRLAGKGPQDMLFDELASASNPSDTFGKRFKRWREAVGVADSREGVRRSLVNFHSARRWFTTKARHAGQSKETIADVIGHRPDKQDVTFGVYAREASQDQKRACVEAVTLP